ncbi:MAG: hypothetical protein ACTSQ8_22250 [Candidatus Helarchaeota archaeon]
MRSRFLRGVIPAPWNLKAIPLGCELVGILIGLPPKKHQPEDFQIQPETPVFQIKNIVFNTLCNVSAQLYI